MRFLHLLSDIFDTHFYTLIHYFNVLFFVSKNPYNE